MERKNRTIIEMARGLLKSGELPVKFWAEAVSTAIHLINQSPTQALHNKTPYEAWHGVKPNVSYLKVFRSIAFDLIPSHKHQKLNDKSKRCVFVGYYPETKACKLFDPITCKVVVSRDVVFHEGSWWNWEVAHQGHPEFTIEESADGPGDAVEDNSGSNVSDTVKEGEVSTSEVIPVQRESE